MNVSFQMIERAFLFGASSKGDGATQQTAIKCMSFNKVLVPFVLEGHGFSLASSISDDDNIMDDLKAFGFLQALVLSGIGMGAAKFFKTVKVEKFPGFFWDGFGFQSRLDSRTDESMVDQKFHKFFRHGIGRAIWFQTKGQCSGNVSDDEMEGVGFAACYAGGAQIPSPLAKELHFQVGLCRGAALRMLDGFLPEHTKQALCAAFGSYEEPVRHLAKLSSLEKIYESMNDEVLLELIKEF